MPPGETPDQPEGTPPSPRPQPPGFSAQPGRWPRQAPRPVQRANYGARPLVTPPQPSYPAPPNQPVEAAPPQSPLPQQPVPAEQTLQTPAAPGVLPPPAPTPPIEPPVPPQFQPPHPKKSKRRLIKILVIIFIILLLAGALFAAWSWQKSRTNPDKAFHDAMQASLSTVKLQANTTTDNLTSEVKYDFSAPKNPLVSSQSTLKIADSQFELKGYGSAKNSYISYTKLPPSVSAPLATAVRDGWVQLRTDGSQQPGIPYKLTNLADPRYQAFGPIIFGNFDPHTRSQLVDFERAHSVYAYDPVKVTRTTVDNTKVLAYSIRLNTGFLKVLNQSAATSEGLGPNEIQNAIAELDNYKNTKSMLYISIAHHRLVRAEFGQAGQVKTVDYSQYGTASLAAEPQTKLNWLDFATFQYQIEAQAASRQTAPSIDADRKAQLNQIHDQLATYFTITNSFPTLNQLNDQAWVQTNLPGLDPDSFRDPLGASPHLATAPKAANIAYQPQGANPKLACDDSPLNLCTQYVLTIILSDNVPFVVHQP